MIELLNQAKFITSIIENLKIIGSEGILVREDVIETEISSYLENQPDIEYVVVYAYKDAIRIDAELNCTKFKPLQIPLHAVIDLIPTDIVWTEKEKKFSFRYQIVRTEIPVEIQNSHRQKVLDVLVEYIPIPCASIVTKLITQKSFNRICENIIEKSITDSIESVRIDKTNITVDLLSIDLIKKVIDQPLKMLGQKGGAVTIGNLISLCSLKVRKDGIAVEVELNKNTASSKINGLLQNS